MITIRTNADRMGMITEITADTLEQAVAELQSVVQACGPESADVIIEDGDYLAVESPEEVLDRLGVRCRAIRHEDRVYVITSDTGEVPGACFAYDAEDQSLSPSPIDSYNEFCRSFDVIDDYELAQAAALLGYRLFYAGDCTPILSEDVFAALSE